MQTHEKCVQVRNGGWELMQKIKKEQLIDDFIQVMGERGGMFDLLDTLDMTLADALSGIASEEEINTHYYWHIQPLEVNQKTRDKIVQHYGINGLVEFMACDAGWEQYVKMMEVEN